jgi:hypothetical protein
MPVKRRVSKRRITPEAELQIWAAVFEWGTDYFHDLGALGLADSPAARKEAREAWKRLGADFMRSWQPKEGRERPWALVRFGPPSLTD